MFSLRAARVLDGVGRLLRGFPQSALKRKPAPGDWHLAELALARTVYSTITLRIIPIGERPEEASLIKAAYGHSSNSCTCVNMQKQRRILSKQLCRRAQAGFNLNSQIYLPSASCINRVS